MKAQDEFVYRVVDSKGNQIRTKMSGDDSNWTYRTYATGQAASTVATRKNNALGYDEYRIQVSKVDWQEYDVVTRKAIA